MALVGSLGLGVFDTSSWFPRYLEDTWTFPDFRLEVGDEVVEVFGARKLIAIITPRCFKDEQLKVLKIT